MHHGQPERQGKHPAEGGVLGCAGNRQKRIRQYTESSPGGRQEGRRYG
jgi:hypothetical protein